MATLDRVIEMKKRGMKDAEISTQLQNEGISPAEINDSLNQAQIKDAVSPQNIGQQNTGEIRGQTQEISQQQNNQTAQMQQSIMQPVSEQQPQLAIPEQPQQGIQQQYPSPEQTQQEYQGYYPETPQAYPQEAYYQQPAGLDTDTISEIAEQVVQEKFADFEKKTGDLVSFKNEIKGKVSDIDERLKKIENSIDKLQQAIIGKIGEFGETTQAIHKDLDALHNTTSKLMNPLIDNYKELKKIANKK